MKLNYKYKKIMAYVFAVIIIIFFAINIILNDINTHEVEIKEKCPVFPYQNYDYMTTEDAIFSIDNEIQVIPAFFRTDFASIPRLLWIVNAPYKASFIYPALWHDYMYMCPGKKTRKEIDETFYWLLLHDQNSIYTALKMYIAVRLFGGLHFAEQEFCEEVVVQIENDEKYFNKENSNHG